MRILFINPYYYPNEVGGTERVVRLLAESFLKRNHKVAVYTVDSQKTGLYADIINGVKVYRGEGGLFKAPKVNEKYSRIINSVVQRINVTIKRELQSVVLDFEPEVAHVCNLYGFSPLIWSYLYEMKIPIIHTLNDYWLMNKSVKLFVKNNIRYVNFFSAPSSYTLNKFDRLIPESDKAVIQNGICIKDDFCRDCIIEKNEKNEEDTKFLYVGQLLKIKGLDRLLAAFENLDNSHAELHICGEGELQSLVSSSVERDKRIIYHGHVNADQLSDIYRQCDVLVIPSVWDEPFGMVAIEGYYHGLYVIASKRGGLGEIVEKIGVGELIDPECEKGLLDVLQNYSKRIVYQDSLIQIENRIESYNVEKQADEYERVYEKIRY